MTHLLFSDSDAPFVLTPRVSCHASRTGRLRWGLLVLLSMAVAGEAHPLAAQELAALKGHTGDIYCVAISPDGKTVATGGWEQIKLWEASTGKEQRTLKLNNKKDASSLAFSPDGKTLASACGDEGVKLWDVATGKELAAPEGKPGYVYSVAFAPDGKVLAAGVGGGLNSGTRRR